MVKGVYFELVIVVYFDKVDVDQNYCCLVFQYFKVGNYINVVIYDECIIDDVKWFVLVYGIGKDVFEFQMFYGICCDL